MIQNYQKFLKKGRQVKSFSLVDLAIAQRVSKSATVFFFSSVRREKGVGSQAFLTATVETGDKNCDDFHCMQMSLLMSMRFIFGNDWYDACKLNTFW